MTKTRGNSLGWIVWSCAALFYGFQFVLRVSTSVIANELMDTLALDACMLGTLTSFYYYGYSSMQVPSGIILDRLGPKRPLVLACLMCACGAFLFGYGQNLFVLSMGRLMMGVGSAFAFLSCVKLASLYFEARILSILVGLTLTIGSLGGVVGGAPFGFLADTFGWRMANFVLAGVSIVIALTAFIFIKEGNFQKIQKEERRGESLVDSVMTILRNPQSWIYGLYGCAMYVPLSGFADLWSTPFLMESYQVERTIAAGTMSIFYVGLSFGAPLWSVLATRLKSYRKGMMYSAMVSVFCLTAVIYLPVSFTVLKVLMFIAGFSVGGQFIAFAGVTQLNPAHRTGTAAGVHNMLCMLSGAAMQPLIGKCLDLCLAADQCGIGTHYTHEYFLKSLALVPLCVLVAVILAYFMKETFPVQEKT